MGRKVNTATINLKDMKFLQDMKKSSGYDYKQACTVLGEQLLKGLGLDGEIPMTEYLLNNGRAARVVIDHNGKGIFDL